MISKCAFQELDLMILVGTFQLSIFYDVLTLHSMYSNLPEKKETQINHALLLIRTTSHKGMPETTRMLYNLTHLYWNCLFTYYRLHSR